MVNDGILDCTMVSSMIMDGHMFGGLCDVAALNSTEGGSFWILRESVLPTYVEVLIRKKYVPMVFYLCTTYACRGFVEMEPRKYLVRTLNP